MDRRRNSRQENSMGSRREELWWPVPSKTCPNTKLLPPLCACLVWRLVERGSQWNATTQNPPKLRPQLIGWGGPRPHIFLNFLWPTLRDPSARYLHTKKDKSPITLRGSHRQLTCKNKRQDGEAPNLPCPNSFSRPRQRMLSRSTDLGICNFSIEDDTPLTMCFSPSSRT